MEFVDENQGGAKNHRDQYFKGQQSNEVMICFLRHHWVYLIKEVLYFAVFAFVVILTVLNMETIKEILRGNREIKLLFMTAFFVVTFFMHRFFIKLLNFFVNVGIITDIRFIDHQKSLFLKDSVDSIDMGQIQNIEMIENGLLPNLLGYGDLKFYLAAMSAEKTYKCLPNIKFHYRCLTRLKEARQQMLFQRQRSNVDIHDIAGHENVKILHQQMSDVVQTAKSIPFEDKSMPRL